MEQLYNLCKGDFKISTNSFKILVGIPSAPGAFFGFNLFISVSICFSVALLNENFSAWSTCVLILIILGWLGYIYVYAEAHELPGSCGCCAPGDGAHGLPGSCGCAATGDGARGQPGSCGCCAPGDGAKDCLAAAAAVPPGTGPMDCLAAAAAVPLGRGPWTAWQLWLLHHLGWGPQLAWQLQLMSCRDGARGRPGSCG